MSNGSLLDFLRKPQTKQELKFKDQIDMASQCADGMAYLESTVSLPFESGYSGDGSIPGNLFDSPGKIRQIKIVRLKKIKINYKNLSPF